MIKDDKHSYLLKLNGLPSIALTCDVTTPENKLWKAGVASWSERETHTSYNTSDVFACI